MSVLVSDRTESKFEAITYSIELHDMLIDLMQRSFGVKDLDQLVRIRYAHGKDATEDFSRYRLSVTPTICIELTRFLSKPASGRKQRRNS